MIGSIIGALIVFAGTIAGKVLLFLGFGFVTYTGITVALDWAKALFIANITGMPSIIVGILGVLQVDTAMTIIVSAVSARLLMQGLTGGAIRRLIA